MAVGVLHQRTYSHTVVMTRGGKFDRQRRVAVAAAALVAAALVACLMVSSSSMGSAGGVARTELVDSATGVSLSATSSAVIAGSAVIKSIHPATGTLSLFDTTGTDHDGEKWSPPPKLTPAQAAEHKAEVAILSADKNATKVKEVNVRNEPAIHKMEQSLVSSEKSKAGALMSTRAERLANYAKIKQEEMDKVAAFKAKVASIKQEVDESRKREKEIQGWTRKDATDGKAKKESGKYDDWYAREYQRSLAKVMEEKKAFADKVKTAKWSYENSYSSALALDRKRQESFEAEKAQTRSGLTPAEVEMAGTDAERAEHANKAKLADEAALEKQVDEITGHVDKASEHKGQADKADATKGAKDVSSLGSQGEGAAKAGVKAEAKARVKAEAKAGVKTGVKAEAKGQGGGTKMLSADGEKGGGASKTSLKGYGLMEAMVDAQAKAEMRDESRRAEDAKEEEMKVMEKREEADKKAEEAMGNKARQEEKQAEKKLMRAGWGDAASVGAGARK